jgi:hypothetical protein
MEKDQGKSILIPANGGDSLEAAIVIHNADDTSQGVAAEHQYLHVLLGERKIIYDLTEQQLLQRDGRHYDQLVYQTAAGKSGSLLFNITGFFGRFAEEIAAILGEKNE